MRLRWLIVVSLVGLVMSFGLYRYWELRKHRRRFDPKRTTSIAESMISYQLPPGYSPTFGLDTDELKICHFRCEVTAGLIVTMNVPIFADIGFSDEDIGKLVWGTRDAREYTADDGLKDLLKRGPGGVGTIASPKEQGTLRLLDGSELPYERDSFTKDGVPCERFFGSVKFSDADGPILVFHAGPRSTYDFGITKRFIETIGPPDRD